MTQPARAVDPASDTANRTTTRPNAVQAGTVTEFDHDRALGIIQADSGPSYDFHSIEIADGSRSIGVGARVLFELLPRFGAYQAGRIVVFHDP